MLLLRFLFTYNNFRGKVILITGASEGIGAALATACRARGAMLSLVARNAERLREIGGPDAVITVGDITHEAIRRKAIEATVARFGRLDILVNNAGRGLYYRASDTPIDEARALMELNFFAPLALAQLATPHLRASKGSLVNVASIAAQIALPWLPIYSASKFALASLTSSQRMELHKDGVHVLCVYPGYVRTAFQDHAIGPRPPQVVVQGKRFAVTPEQCAETIIRGIARRRNTVVTPWIGWGLVWLHRFFPALVESKMRLAETDAS